MTIIDKMKELKKQYPDKTALFDLKTGNKLERPSNEEKYNVLKQHIELCIKEKGEKVAINEMRKHIAYYTKNLKDASSFRVKVNQIDNKKELIETLEKFFLQDNA